jgi:putative transposase
VLAHAGAARVAHNWALAKVKAVMDQRAAERSYGVAEEQLTPSLSWSLAGLRKAWNQAKGDVAPWWAEVSKEAFNTGLDALARGLTNWADSRRGARAGRPVGFPRFKSRRRTTPSVRFTPGCPPRPTSADLRPVGGGDARPAEPATSCTDGDGDDV